MTKNEFEKCVRIVVNMLVDLVHTNIEKVIEEQNPSIDREDSLKEIAVHLITGYFPECPVFCNGNNLLTTTTSNIEQLKPGSVTCKDNYLKDMNFDNPNKFKSENNDKI